MSAIVHPTVLDWFRSQKHQPLIQFLTWYIVLVNEWEFEDITHLVMADAPPDGSFTRVRRYCRFVFRNGDVETLLVVMGSGGKFYVQSSFRVAHTEMSGEQQ